MGTRSSRSGILTRCAACDRWRCQQSVINIFHAPHMNLLARLGSYEIEIATSYSFRDIGVTSKVNDPIRQDVGVLSRHDIAVGTITIHSRGDGKSETTGTEPQAIASSTATGMASDKGTETVTLAAPQVRHVLVWHGIHIPHCGRNVQLVSKVLYRGNVDRIAPLVLQLGACSGYFCSTLANAATTVSWLYIGTKLLALKTTGRSQTPISLIQDAWTGPGKNDEVSTPHCTSSISGTWDLVSWLTRARTSSESPVTIAACLSAPGRSRLVDSENSSSR